MAHNCVDWTAQPPARKTPLLVLSHGDDHVYAVVPKELETLEAVARKEFDIGDADIRFESSCANLCHGRPARITEEVWEYIRSFIGCATVVVARPAAVRGGSSSSTADERNSNVKRNRSLDAEGGHENDHAQEGQELSKPTSAVKTDSTSFHGNDPKRASAIGDEGPWEEEVSEVFPPRPQHRRRLVFEDDDDDDERSEQEHSVPANPLLSPVASPTRQTPLGKEIKESVSDHHALPLPESQPAEPLHQPNRPIKQEKVASESETQSTHTESRYETPTQTAVESSEKLTIRVAHRPSNQEAKFITKGTTSVGKVLTGACKSFGLNAGEATLYLIVAVEEEDRTVDSLFPCDRNDTITRAGAERDRESRFLLMVAGET